MEQENKITLEISAGGKSVYSSIPNANDGHKHKVIEGIFGIFGVSTQSVPQKIAPAKAEAPEAPSRPTVPAKSGTPVVPAFNLGLQTHPNTPEEPSVPKHIPNPVVVEGEPTSMAEAFAKAAPPQPTEDWHTTGIKVKDGVKHYRTRYICTKCGCKGNHYIPEGVEQVDCHECQTSLLVKKAVPGTQGLSKQDKFGNWYVAGAFIPVNPVIDKFVHNRLRK